MAMLLLKLQTMRTIFSPPNCTPSWTCVMYMCDSRLRANLNYWQIACRSLAPSHVKTGGLNFLLTLFPVEPCLLIRDIAFCHLMREALSTYEWDPGRFEGLF